jgi:coenzyme F420-dependent glucose-6-phosphate dehydrogenase
MDGGWFRLDDAKLYTRAGSPPKLYVSAFGPQAARIAGRHGDGVWTLGDPEQAPAIIDAYRASCAEHDRPVGEIILHTGIAWAETEQQVIDGARRWKPTQLPSVYRDDLHDPAEMQRLAEAEVSDDEFAHEGFIVSADVEHHVSRLRELCELGPTVVCTQLIGRADPHGTIRTYGESVLPALRRAGGAAT